MRKHFYFQLFFWGVIIFIFSCNSHYQPEITRKGYFKIEFPEKKYLVFDQSGYPYTFEYPVYSTVIKDTTFFDAKPENDWWINIDPVLDRKSVV